MLATFAAIVAIVALASVPLKSSIQSQQDCQPTAVNVTTPAPDGFLTAESPAVCKDNNGNVLDQDVSAGGFVLVNTTIGRDSSALVTGSCNIMYWNYTNGGFCQQFPPPQTRYLMGIDFLTNPPTELASHNFLFAPYHVTQWDTRPSSGLAGNPDEVGTWLYQFQSTAFNTICTPSVKSNITNNPLQVVACLPVFFPTTVRLPIDGQDISVNLPHGDDPNDLLTMAFDAATAAWAAQLAPAVNLPNFVKSDVLCAPLDSHCIQVTVQNPPSDPTACAETDTHPGSDGNFDQSALVSINPAYVNWSSDFLNQTLQHEFGHMFDLKHQNPYCSVGSVMDVPQRVGCNDMTGRFLVQPSDAVAVTQGTYGNSPQKMCGKPPGT